MKGALNGSVNANDNAPGSPQKVPLTGTSTYVQLRPAKLDFGVQPVGTKGLPKKVTLTNQGHETLHIASIAITGADAGDFAETNNCGHQVASGSSCFIKVTFKPLLKGKRAADVSLSDDGGSSPQKVSLKGTGT
jgi:Abnormal spindle-like microcephaly-assoc'd, ASPM-SPD-2-Hydin